MQKKQWTFYLFSISIAVVVGYLALMIQSSFIADRILFQPPKATYQDNPSILKLKTRNGKRISAIYLPNAKSHFVILYSHGNAIDLGKLYPLLLDFQKRGYAIFAYDYEGYGTSEGYPSEQNTYLDIEAAYDYLTKELKFSPKQIVAMGVSLGTGVTLELAKQKPLAGVILQGPFVSAYRVYTLIPLFPFDKYNNIQKIKEVTVPILLIHGGKDQTIPFWHANKLFQAIKGPKQALWVAGAHHNNIHIIASSAYWRAISYFLATLRERSLSL